MHDVGPYAPGAVHDPAHAHGIDLPSAVGVGFAIVHCGPRTRVDDRVRRGGGDGSEHGVAVGEVEAAVVARQDLVTCRVADAHQVVAELSTRTGHQHPHVFFSGRHHHSLSRYQATVSSSASSRVRCFFHPRSEILVMSTE